MQTIPPSVQPPAEKQQGEEKANPTGADTEKAGQAKAADAKPKAGETEEKLPFDPNEFVTKPEGTGSAGASLGTECPGGCQKIDRRAAKAGG